MCVFGGSPKAEQPKPVKVAPPPTPQSSDVDIPDSTQTQKKKKGYSSTRAGSTNIETLLGQSQGRNTLG